MTYSMKKVHILREGEWTSGNGKKIQWNEKDFDEAIRNFEHGLSKMPIKVTEDGNHGSKPLALPGSAALGWVSKVYKQGKDLFADLVAIPKTVYELIKEGAFNQCSVEGTLELRPGDGKNYGRAFSGLMLFGTGLPGITGLESLAALYRQPEGGDEQAFSIGCPGGFPVVVIQQEDPVFEQRMADSNSKGKKMGDISIDQVRYEQLIAAEARLKDMETRVNVSESANKELAHKMTEAAEQAAKDAADLKAYREREAITQRQSVATIAHKLVEDGKLPPASEVATVDLALGMKPEERDAYFHRLETLHPIFGDRVGNARPAPGTTPASTETPSHADISAMGRARAAAQAAEIAHRKQEGR